MNAAPFTPRPALAALLNLFASPLGWLYAARPGWAAAYFALALASGLLGFARWPSAAWAWPPAGVALLSAAHGLWLLRGRPTVSPRPFYSRAPGLLLLVTGLLLLVLGLRAFALEPFRMPSNSMLPTLQTDAHLLVQKWGYGSYETLGLRLAQRPLSAPLQRGELLVFRAPRSGDKWVKRLIGLPGDELLLGSDLLALNGQPIQRRADGEVQDENGQMLAVSLETGGGLQQRVIAQGARPFLGDLSQASGFATACQTVAEGLRCTVPPGQLMLLGDNRPNSADSRLIGFVPVTALVGKVVAVF